MADEPHGQMGIIQSLVHDMPPFLKFILMALLTPIIALALAGILLQVNIGAIIQKTMDENMRKNQITIQSSVSDGIGTEIISLRREITRTNNLNAERINRVEAKLDQQQRDIDEIKRWACQNSRIPIPRCP